MLPPFRCFGGIGPVHYAYNAIFRTLCKFDNSINVVDRRPKGLIWLGKAKAMDSVFENIVIDLEFTRTPHNRGVDAFKNEIIEIGAVRVDCRGNILDSFHTYVKPDFAEEISGKVKKLTGIKDSDLIGAPCFVDAMEMLASWIGSDGRKRIVAWSKTDRKQVVAESTVKGYELPMHLNRWLDLQAVLPRVLRVGSRGRLMSLRRAVEWYGNEIDANEAHQALYDAMQTADLLAQVLDGSIEEHLAVLDSVMPQRGRRGDEGFGMGTMAKALSELYAQMRSDDAAHVAKPA